MARPHKRIRKSDGGAYYDPIPLDDYSLIHVREGRLQQLQTRGAHDFCTAQADRVPQHTSGSWESTNNWMPPDDVAYALDADGGWYDEALDRPVMEELASSPEIIQIVEEKKKKKKSLVSRRPHVVWKEIHRQTYLDEMLCWDGRGDFISSTQCPDCLSQKAEPPCSAEYRHRTNPFHLIKRWTGTSFEKDPGLGTGLAYMVPRIPYESYVLSRADNDNISTYVGFQALAKANTKFSRGLRYTGVGAVVCGRSEMVMPSGVGNLQKGERYANMDYIFASVLRYIMMPLVVISYDIACQWFTNLYNRMNEHWPNNLKIPELTKLTPAIPKLHEPAHQAKNHEMYSLNYLPGVGMSDCECPEHVPHTSSKIQGSGGTEKYSNGSTSTAWERMCQKWDDDQFPKKVKSPYKSNISTMSEAEVRKKLENEENERLKQGGISMHNTSPWVFIAMGLDLEDMQRRRRILHTRIKDWEQILPIFMPGVLQYQNDIRSKTGSMPSNGSTTSARQSDLPENEEIWLPLRVPTADRGRICIAGLAALEEQLRDAQLQDALDSVRMILQMKTRMVQFKNANIHGQRDGTRSRAMIDRVHDRARVCVEKYRVARLAKLSLSGSGRWEEKFKVMEDGDVRGYQDANRLRPRQGRAGTLEDSQVDGVPAVVPGSSSLEDRNFLLPEEHDRRDGTGETRRTLSWIWQVRDASNDTEADEDIIRTEWARSRARVNRAKEEVLLLKEEMRRVLAFLDWKRKWWMDRITPRVDITRDLAEGLRSYAEYQAGIQGALRQHFLDLWQSPLTTPTEPDNINSSTGRQATAGIEEEEDDDDGDLEVRVNEMFEVEEDEEL
ncbi:hypothetical protein CPC08DRAFT_766536 [Agrocybe pediades]|nr:hypothetical protein CPC08DRAFT_766536 [Agrocybe pediades]